MCRVSYHPCDGSLGDLRKPRDKGSVRCCLPSPSKGCPGSPVVLGSANVTETTRSAGVSAGGRVSPTAWSVQVGKPVPTWPHMNRSNSSSCRAIIWFTVRRQAPRLLPTRRHTFSPAAGEAGWAVAAAGLGRRSVGEEAGGPGPAAVDGDPRGSGEAHTHTHTHAPWGQGPLLTSQRSRGLNGRRLGLHPAHL